MHSTKKILMKTIVIIGGSKGFDLTLTNAYKV